MALTKWRRFLSKLSSLLPKGCSTTNLDTHEIQQLRKGIADHGQIAFRLYSRAPVRIYVREIASRLRETRHDVGAALALLERKGWATRTKQAGLWTLHMYPQPAPCEVFTRTTEGRGSGRVSPEGSPPSNQAVRRS